MRPVINVGLAWYTMGHYQEEEISYLLYCLGVKGFTSDRGSIPKESLRSRGRSLRGRGGLLRDAPEEILRPMTNFDNVIFYVQVLRGSVAQLVNC